MLEEEMNMKNLSFWLQTVTETHPYHNMNKNVPKTINKYLFEIPD